MHRKGRPTMVKKVLGFTLRLAVVCLGLILVVQAIAALVWALPGAGERTIAQARASAKAQAQREAGRAKIGHHRVEPWSRGESDGERSFQQAPMFDAPVEAGALPPVAARLPDEPLVIVPPEQRGPYGGTWRRYDINQISHIVNMLFRIGNESLIRWDPDGDDLIPNLASRWEASDDAREHTIYLRKGVRWSDGHPFTADDILFWYEHVIRSHTYTGSIPRAFMRGGEPMELEKVDNHTIIFRFKAPNPLLPIQLASLDPYMHMLQYPRHYLEQFHEDFTSSAALRRRMREANARSIRGLFRDKQGYRNPACPRLWAWVPREAPTTQAWPFERNPYYWKVDDAGNQLPYIDRLVFEWMDAELINLQLIGGNVGMQARRVEFDNYALFARKAEAGNYRVLEWEPGGGGELAVAFNINRAGDPFLRELFNERKFRIAMSHAIDREAINQVQYMGLGTPRQMAPPKGSPYYSRRYERAHLAHDPDKANALLDELGLDQRSADGFRLRPDGRPLQILLEVSPAVGSAKALRLLASHWRAVGIDAQVRLMAGPLINNRQVARQHDVVIWWGENEKMPLVDPRWFVPVGPGSDWAPAYRRWHQSEGEAGATPSTEIASLFELWNRIEVEPDAQQRIRLWQEINAINRENLWVTGLVGEVPKLVLKHERFRNVPDRAVYGFVFRSPGVTAPECYAIDTTEER
ncbi:MAG: ABC transporter substrate-binding protein [Phycisphaeraceae bacterium]